MAALTQLQIKQLFNKAQRILKNPGLDFLIAPTSSPQQPHLIVITPGKIGNAVQRNTIRRRIKALFHEEKWDQKGFDCVAIIKKPGVSLSHAQLKNLIASAFQKYNQPDAHHENHQ